MNWFWIPKTNWQNPLVHKGQCIIQEWNFPTKSPTYGKACHIWHNLDVLHHRPRSCLAHYETLVESYVPLPGNVPLASINALISALNIMMHWNVFKFGDSYFKQLIGLPWEHPVQFSLPTYTLVHMEARNSSSFSRPPQKDPRLQKICGWCLLYLDRYLW